MNNKQNLLMQQRFLPYFITQFLGAFNDNIYKNALIILITYRLVTEGSGLLVNLAAGLFILPFLLFSSLAGQLADKYEKSKLIQNIKLAEIVIMLVGATALVFQSIPTMMFVLFLLGTQSAFFGPIKYSILPQYLHDNELVKGNGIVEAGTFLAILFGTIVGGILASKQGYIYVLMVCLLVVAIVGWLSSRKIPKGEAGQADLQIDWNILRSGRQIIAKVKTNKQIFLAILAISWFWFFGAVVLTQFPNFTKGVLQSNAQVATLLLATFSVGIALGSITCSKLSGDHVEIGLMPIGALGISYFTWHLGGLELASIDVLKDGLRTITELLSTKGSWRVLFDLTMMAFSAGLFIVPLYSFIQVRSDNAERARTIAANNIINSLFMVLAAIFAVTALKFGVSVTDIFKITAVLNLVVTVYILTVVPAFFLRLVGWLLIHSVYRIKKYDLHHIPQKGAALLVCNHVSFADPMIVNAICNRPIRFVMIENIYKLPVANWFFKLVRAIPIAPTKINPDIVQQAFDEIDTALSKGELVCIFPEGGITKDGELNEFKPGIEKIIERNPVPIIPLAIKGLWGTWFSLKQGGAMNGLPKQFMKRLTVVSGEAVAPQGMTKELMYQKVLDLRGDEK